MKKRTVIVSVLIALVLMIMASSIVFAATADNFTTVAVGNYTWYNYDFNDQTAVYNNVDWPLSIIFWGPDAEVDAAHSLLWAWNIAGIQDAKYFDGSNWEWDSDAGRKSALGDVDAWHCRIYAETSGDRCTHNTWQYYVIGSTHRDYENYALWEYFGDTNDANIYVCAKADDTVGVGNITSNFFYMSNYEDWRREGASEPYHVWDFDGYAEGIHMDW